MCITTILYIWLLSSCSNASQRQWHIRLSNEQLIIKSLSVKHSLSALEHLCTHYRAQSCGFQGPMQESKCTTLKDRGLQDSPDMSIYYKNVNKSHTHLNLQARVRLQPKFGERRVALSFIRSNNKKGAILGKYRYLI